MKYFLVVICYLIFGCNARLYKHGSQHESMKYLGNYTEGCYYTISGKKVSGLIQWDCSSNSLTKGMNFIKFKKNYDDPSYLYLTTNDINAFVLGVDSFTIIKSFSYSKHKYITKDFAKVLVKGCLNLYLHYQIVAPDNSGRTSGGVAWCYFLQKDNMIYRLRKDDFKDRANFLFGDDTELINKINKKELDFNDLEFIVAEYNVWCKNKNVVAVPKE